MRLTEHGRVPTLREDIGVDVLGEVAGGEQSGQNRDDPGLGPPCGQGDTRGERKCDEAVGAQALVVGEAVDRDVAKQRDAGLATTLGAVTGFAEVSDGEPGARRSDRWVEGAFLVTRRVSGARR
jgi:hypothetical protein